MVEFILVSKVRMKTKISLSLKKVKEIIYPIVFRVVFLLQKIVYEEIPNIVYDTRTYVITA